MPIFSTDDLRLIYEALDQLAEVHSDTVMHDGGVTLDEEEIAELQRELELANALKARILPYIA